MLPVPGFYDRFNPSSTPWKSVLFKPGVALQAAELNEIQSVLRGELEQLGQTIYEHSAPIAGLDAVVNLDDLEVSITEGKLYALGMIHNVPAAVIEILGVGVEVIGVILTPQVLTYTEDPTLMDPAVGAENYGYAGADRLLYVATVVKVGPGTENAYPIAEIVDGQLSNKYSRVRPLWSKFISYLEQRTYEESGHYLIQRPRIAILNTTPERLLFRVNDLAGYVMGRRISVESTALPIDTALTTMSVLDEPHVFVTGTLKYLAYNQPIRTIPQFTGRVYEEQSMTRGGVPNGTDTVPSQFWPVAQVLEVSAGATTYIAGVDYVVSGNSINWSLGGAEPSPGSTYTVKFLYIRQFIKQLMQYSGAGSKTDIANWNVTTAGDYLARDSFRKADTTVDFYETPTTVGADTAVDFRKHVVFTAGGVKPYNGTEFQLDYFFTLPNIYVMAVNEAGVVYLSQGKASVEPTLPNFGPNFLPFARFLVPPEALADALTTIHLDVVRLSMVELQRMLKDVKTLQYNQAIFQLHNELTSRDMATDKRAVWADSLNDYIPCDYASPNFGASLDTEAGTAYLSIDTEDLTPVLGTTTAEYRDKSWTLPYTNREFIAQRLANLSIQVNAYDYVNLGAVVSLSPNEDRHIAEEYFVVDTLTDYRYTAVLPVKNVAKWDEVYAIGNDLSVNAWQVYYQTVDQATKTVATSTTRVDLLSSVKTAQLSYLSHARQLTLTVVGENFLPNEEVTVKFSGQQVVAAPTVGFVVGVEVGTVRANSTGQIGLTFQVPPNQLNDLHKVSLIGDGGPLGSAGTYAEVNYLSDARLRTTTTANNYLRTTRTELQETVTTTVTSYYEGYFEPPRPIDPVAQTFLPEDDAPLSAIQLWFRTKGVKPVQVLVVDVENGVPTGRVLAQKTLPASAINVSTDASAATLFQFDQFFYVFKGREYAIVVKTDEAATQLWVNQFGAASGQLKNPYTGVFLRSANARTWSAEQLLDMKFVIFAANFTATQAEVNLRIDFVEPRGMFMLTGTQIQPNEKTLVQWQYNVGAGWQNFSLNRQVRLTALTAGMDVRAVLNGTSQHSPIVNEDFRLRGGKYDLTGGYEGREFVVETDDIRYVDLWIDERKPSGTTLTPQVSFDGGTTWLAMTNIPLDDRVVDAGGEGTVERHYLYDTGSDASLRTRIKLRVNMTTADAAISPAIRRVRSIARTI
jgi:hypothetical protein